MAQKCPCPDPALSSPHPETKEEFTPCHHERGGLLGIYCELSMSNTSFYSPFFVPEAILSDQHLLHPRFREEEVSTERGEGLLRGHTADA